MQKKKSHLELIDSVLPWQNDGGGLQGTVGNIGLYQRNSTSLGSERERELWCFICFGGVVITEKPKTN